MYTSKNIIYADPGKYLVCKNQVSFQLPASDEIKEYPLNIEDMVIKNNVAYYNNGLCIQNINPRYTYADYKKEIIKKRYSNDDQIAIMLNKEDSDLDRIKYDRMMKWREFASLLAKKIIETINH